MVWSGLVLFVWTGVGICEEVLALSVGGIEWLKGGGERLGREAGWDENSMAGLQQPPKRAIFRDSTASDRP